MEKIKRDKTHMEQVERWAHYVRTHPDEWKQLHTEFINAVYEKAQDAIKKLSKQKGGREKIIKLYRIKNIKACKKLLG
ncbi:MAG TPA: hypothetical protein VI894_04240 [Candidatus Nanoarchaeia archaeon]|nr:hypothetical protein [Candidatus Nanoarchaeia archaeon]